MITDFSLTIKNGDEQYTFHLAGVMENQKRCAATLQTRTEMGAKSSFFDTAAAALELLEPRSEHFRCDINAHSGAIRAYSSM